MVTRFAADHRFQQYHWIAAATAFAFAFASCSSGVMRPRGTSTDPLTDDPNDPTSISTSALARSFFPSDAKSLTPPRVYRLTQEQLRFALEDLFAVKLNATQVEKLGRDSEALGYTNNASVLDLQTTNTSSMYELFRELAKGTVTQLGKLSTCLTAPLPTNACVRGFIQSYGLKVFRQPLSVDQENRFADLYTAVRDTGASVSVAIQFVVEALLRSPAFLFREEVGAVVGAGRPLSANELASALAATLTRHAPDSALTAKAADGTLTQGDILKAEVQRILELPQARQTTVEFFKEWLRIKDLEHTEKDLEVYPFFDAALKSAMIDETSTLITTELEKAKPQLTELMTTSKSFLKRPLDKIYGLTDLTDTAVEKSLDPSQRAGLLTQPSLMTALADQLDSHPIKRGLFVLTRALCQSTPALPRNANVSLPDLIPGETKRQRFSRHSTDAVCSSCHRVIDPFGFGLENLDGVGAFRSTEQGTPIDATASIEFLPYTKGSTTTPADLSRFLAKAPEFHACFVRQMFRYTMGRQETEGDDPVLRDAYTHFVNTDYDLKELQLFLVSSETFTQRSL